MITDVIIIGGGSAGLFSAVYLKKNYPELSVRLFEALPRVGKKLSLTGNGRCNITNRCIDISRYHGKNKEFCRYALEYFDRSRTQDFFEKIGVPFCFEGDKGYPASLQAGSVVDCLRFAAEELGVSTYTDTKITNIQISGGYYKVIADKMSFLCKNIIIATGLFSGGERMGCDGSVLSILKKAGYKAVEVRPSIVQLKTPVDIVRQLKGIKVNANTLLKENGEIIKEEFGEVLFCDYGLSGPPVLQLSGRALRSKEKCEISLDLMPETSPDALKELLTLRANLLSQRCLDEFFTGMINKRLGQVIVKICGCKLTDKVSSLTQRQIAHISRLIKDFSFEIIGHTGFSNSQATSGGLDTNQFSPKTMMSKTNKGLYCVGEILDIDGDCGGFNLQWAWSSSACACDSIGKGDF